MRGAAARRLLGEPGEQDFGPLAIRIALEPDLRLRDVGGDIADDARRVLVEDVCANARLVQPVGDQERIEARACDVEAEHSCPCNSENQGPKGRVRLDFCGVREPGRDLTQRSEKWSLTLLF